MQEAPAGPAREAYKPAEFQRHYRIGNTKFFELVATGALQTYKVGRARYVSRAAAEAWQRSLEAQQGRP